MIGSPNAINHAHAISSRSLAGVQHISRPRFVTRPGDTLLYPTRFLDDLVPGERFDLGSLNIDEADMVGFALKFDPQPHHVDQHAEETIAFGGLIASGMFTLSVAMKLLSTTRLFGENSILGRGIDAVRWPNPLRAGDTVHGRVEIIEVALSSTGKKRGTVRLHLTLVKESGEVALVMEPLIILPCRATPPVEAE